VKIRGLEKTSVVLLTKKFCALFETGKVDYRVESYPQPDEYIQLRAIHSQMNPSSSYPPTIFLLPFGPGNGHLNSGTLFM
jgi:hypothetical protein